MRGSTSDSEVCVPSPSDIARLRARLGITLEAMGDVLFTDKQGVNRFESGERVPRGFRCEVLHALQRGLELHGARRVWPRESLTVRERLTIIFACAEQSRAVHDALQGLAPVAGAM